MSSYAQGYALPQPGGSTSDTEGDAALRGRPPLQVVPLGTAPTRRLLVAKLVVDKVLAGLLLLVLLPVMTVVAVTVRVALGPGVIFRQARVGQGGKVFTLYKFRTMRGDRRADAGVIVEPDRRRTHKSSADPRHTAVGRWLRKAGLDELPQLWNVLRGEMSLVGPRPELPCVVARYEAWQHARHLVKPGITGLWQVSARGRGSAMQDCTLIDIDYVRRGSLRLDAWILLRTIPALLACRGE